jgi:hypothetical protein
MGGEYYIAVPRPVWVGSKGTGFPKNPILSLWQSAAATLRSDALLSD